MAKKAHKKARSGQKDKRVITPSPKIASKEYTGNGETPDSNEVVIVKEREVCPHIEKGIKLEKLVERFESSDPHKCEDCRENNMDRRASKGKSKHGKKGTVNSKSESKALWICLECGHFSCGGVGLPTTPQSHAVRHAKQNHHPLAIHFENSQLVWCFPCNNLVNTRIPEDKDESKDVIHDVAKILKERSCKVSSVDVENTRLGRGSVTSSVVSDHFTSVGGEERTSYSVRGLINLGNTCFFNSTMQNLLALSKFRDCFLKLDESVGPLSASLRKLLLETATKSGIRSALNPRSLFGSFCSKNPQFRGYEQHDSHELLRCFLDSLSAEELIARKQGKSSSAEEKASVIIPTIVDEIFGGQLSSTVSCLECGHSSAIYEPFLDLSLPIPMKMYPSKLAQPNTRGKKPKLPPKRSARISSKVSRNQCVLPAGGASDQSILGNSFSQQQTGLQSSEQLVISSGDLASSTSGDLNSATISTGLTPQNLSDIEQPINQVVDNGGYHSFSTDTLTWLDFIEPTQSSTGVDDAAETEASANVSASQSHATLHIEMVPDAGNNYAHSISEPYLESVNEFNSMEQGVLVAQNNALSDFEDHQSSTSQHDESLSNKESLTKEIIQSGSDLVNCSGSSNHDCYTDSNNEVCSSGRDVEHHTLLQSSDILILPYTEEVSSSVELLRGETEASTSAIGGDELGSAEFDGFGDLFNEPEVSSEIGPSNHVSDASGTAKTRIEGNCSDSDPGEVDNTGNPVSVESCLAFFTKPELLSKYEHSWQCENCAKVLREKTVASKNKPVNEIIPNDCNNTKEHSLSNAGKHFTGAKNGNAEDQFDTLSGRSTIDNEIDDNGSSICRNLPDAETNITLRQTENVTLDSCHDQLGFPSHSGQNLDSCISICGTVSGGLSETNSLPANLESEVSEEEDLEMKRIKVFRDATKSILVTKAPSILTIHLKRFSQDARGRVRKLNGHVNFRETIDLKPYMNPSRYIDNEKCSYRLVGAVEHSGSMKSGHYMAYVRGSECNGHSIWYHASDAHIREASIDEVLRSEAYILFYEKS